MGTFTVGWENREGIAVGGWRKWDWQKKETSIYAVRSMIKRILKKLMDLGCRDFQVECSKGKLASLLNSDKDRRNHIH